MPKHFLDTLPLDFSKREVQELWGVLRTTLHDKKLVRQLLGAAAVLPDLVDFDQPPRHLWHDILTHARNQGKLHALLDAIEKDPACAAIAARIRELRGANPALEPRLPAREALANGAWKEKQERITGARSTLLDISFLAQGIVRARSVARIRTWFPSGELATGTAFLIQPDLLLTNHHVMYERQIDGTFEPASMAEVWLAYEREPDGRLPQHTVAACDASTIDGERGDDWAVVRLVRPITDVPFLSLEPRNPVHVGEPVFIIQHPNGEPKQISLGRNEVRFSDEQVIQYLTDTQGGSSGSPVFNTRWEVVGLHHMWTDADTAEGKPEIRNEGIRIERVLAALRARKYLP